MLMRLDDRIRELCAKLVATQDSSESHAILQQLRTSPWARQAFKKAGPQPFASIRETGGVVSGGISGKKRILRFSQPFRNPIHLRVRLGLSQSAKPGRESHF